MESIQSKLAKAFLRMIKFNRIWKLTGDEFLKNVKKRQLSESHKPPKNFASKFNVKKYEMNGFCYYVIKPLKNLGQKHVLFLHGGGYVYEISILQWRFIKKIINKLNCTITIPIYPLAPKYSYREVFDMIIPIYEQIVSLTNPKDIVIMGDSAGGGMSIALAQLLREKGIIQPQNIILISPALDMTLSNSEIKETEKRDPMLASPSLIYIGKLYGGGKDPKHYLISPIYGSFKDLGKISLFTGTDDILYPDTKQLKKLLDKQGINMNYYEYPSMLHIWPLLFFPESKKAIEKIIEIIKLS